MVINSDICNCSRNKEMTAEYSDLNGISTSQDSGTTDKEEVGRLKNPKSMNDSKGVQSFLDTIGKLQIQTH